MKMIVKIHKADKERKILVLVDSDILGKKFEEGKLQLDLTKDFYKGEEKEKEEIKKLMEDTYIVHIVGKKSLDFCLEQGINIENVVRVEGIPHAEVILKRLS